MRLALVIAIAAALQLGCWGCGSDEATTGTTPQGSPFATITGGKGRTQPHIDPSDRPPPRKALVRDLKVGSGPAVQRGDRVAVYYVGVDYKTGKTKYENWPPSPAPYVVRIGFSSVARAWEEGIEGMRAGGSRELIIPSHLAFKTGTLDYVVKLARILPPSQKTAG